MLPKVDGCEIAVIGGGCPDIKACLEYVGLVTGVLEWSMYIVVPLVEEFFLINAFEECHMVLLVAQLVHHTVLNPLLLVLSLKFMYKTNPMTIYRMKHINKMDE